MRRVSTENHDLVTKALLDEQVVLLPTDTVYGLAAIPHSRQAVEKIFSLKQRPATFNLPIMVAEVEDLYALGLDLNPNALALLNSSLVPGAISLVLGFSGSPRPTWLNGRDEVAIRIPDNAFMLSVLSKTGPLLVTSANKHGSTVNMGVLSEVLQDLNEEPDLIVDGGILFDTSSTIVNCRFDPVKIQRKGMIDLKQLSNYIDYE